MNEKHLKELDDSQLIDELNYKRAILDLCVHGVLNAEYQTTAEGLYWAKEDLFLITREIEDRLINGNKAESD